MTSLKELQKQRASLAGSTRELDAQIAVAMKRKLLKCKGCGKRTQVGKVTYIQTYWYERPYGCTGGDNWHEGEGQWDCPKCGHNHRLIRFDRGEDGNYLKHPTTRLKWHFKEVVKKHDRH